jgi:hypothetical protein
MLNVLAQVEKDLPKLLMADGWKSLYIDYHPPVVERMYRQWERDESIRISLHWIHACDRTASLYHRHPWPSACKLLTGAYWMRVGSSWMRDDEEGPGAVVSEILLHAPSSYEITEREGWHSVSPISDTGGVDSSEMMTYRRSSGGSLSLMVSGPPWGIGETKPTRKLHPLSESQQQNLLDRFRYWYPYRFIDFFRRSEAFPSAFDNFIWTWHAGGTGVSELYDFLGFTEEEYEKWMKNKDFLRKLLVEKKLEFRQRLGTCEGFPRE